MHPAIDPAPARGAVAPVGALAHAPVDLGEVYAEHFDFVWRSARRLGVPDAALDDAVQDVFVVVHDRLPSFEGRSTLRTWLFGIVRRVVRNHRPSQRQMPIEPGDLAAVADGSERASPLESVARAEATRILHALLEQLDDDKREAFVMSDLEQIPVTEIADVLGVNVNTVYARVRAARREVEEGLTRLRAREAWRQSCATK
jgi:RNA polymerase sigma-70 factor (ECF subfamily)